MPVVHVMPAINGCAAIIDLCRVFRRALPCAAQEAAAARLAHWHQGPATRGL